MTDIDRKIARRASLVLEIAQRMAERLREKHPQIGYSSHVHDVQLHFDGYAEPGYSSKTGIVATGNWNDDDYYDHDRKARLVISDLPSRLSTIFERMGVEIEWSDEWSTCDECAKLVRTSGDSYSWQASFILGDGSLTCAECVAEDPEPFLKDIEDDSDHCWTIEDVDPADHGYVKINDDSYESGWHPGQTDNPHQIAKDLRARDVHRFIFVLDESSQFYSRWSVYVHEDETDKLKDKPNEKTGETIDPITLSKDEYHDHVNSAHGLCLACGEIREEHTEPDAKDYKCEVCDAHRVMGFENALIAGHVIVDGQ